MQSSGIKTCEDNKTSELEYADSVVRLIEDFTYLELFLNCLNNGVVISATFFLCKVQNPVADLCCP